MRCQVGLITCPQQNQIAHATLPPAPSTSSGAGPALIPAWTFTNEAAPRFAVFEALATRRMAAGTRLRAPLHLRGSPGHGGGRMNMESQPAPMYFSFSISFCWPHSLSRQKTSVFPRDFVDDGLVFRTCAIFDDLAVEPFRDTPAGGVLHRDRINETFLT
jgi:hypothetical protein